MRRKTKQIGTFPPRKFSSHQEFDFFGEPITFINIKEDDTANNKNSNDDRQLLCQRHDEFMLGVLSRGKSCSGGGGDEGIEVQSAHSLAMVYAPFLIHLSSSEKVNSNGNAPRLVVSAVMPMLVNAGLEYVKKVDLLFRESSVTPDVQMLSMAKDTLSLLKQQGSADAVKMLTPPELLHLEALECMLNDQPRDALKKLLVLLTRSPGDAFAIHCALELAYTLGDISSARMISGSCATYWSERARYSGSGTMNSPGYHLGCSMIALGFAAGNSGSSLQSAEGLAIAAHMNDAENNGAIAAYALCTLYEAEGRSSEGHSTLVGSDGGQNVDGAGWKFFDSKLMGLGARYGLERDGMRASETALRLYDIGFRRILNYNRNNAHLRKAPGNDHTGMRGLFNRLNPFNRIENVNKNENTSNDSAIHIKKTDEKSACSIQGTLKDYSIEDILSWLPPTPSLMTDATILLLNLTTYGSVNSSDERWSELREAWLTHILSKNGCLEQSNAEVSLDPLRNMPLSYAACSLLVRDTDVNKKEDQHEICMNAVLFKAGSMLGLGNKFTSSSKDSTSDDWSFLSQSLYTLQPFIKAWDSDTRALLERLICYSSRQTDDYNGICAARSVCSESITLRANSPEVWWRYSYILDKLGDHEAAENARNTSYSLGKGEGGNISGF